MKMIRYIDHTKMGRGRHGWLDSHFHFSFAEYYNPANIQFGDLRVVNDDMVQPGTGFPTHPHRDMEILSYVVDGELTHGDSMGNEQTLTRGQVQYMSAGTGVTHSEFNLGSSLLRFLQIWIFPDKEGYTPNYGDYRFAFADREGKWLPIATSVNNENSTAPIRVHQDVNVFATVVKAGESARFEVAEGRQAYLVLIEGEAELAGEGGGSARLAERDAAEIVEENVEIRASQDAHVLVLEMRKAA